MKNQSYYKKRVKALELAIQAKDEPLCIKTVLDYAQKVFEFLVNDGTPTEGIRKSLTVEDRENIIQRKTSEIMRGTMVSARGLLITADEYEDIKKACEYAYENSQAKYTKLYWEEYLRTEWVGRISPINTTRETIEAFTQ